MRLLMMLLFVHAAIAPITGAAQTSKAATRRETKQARNKGPNDPPKGAVEVSPGCWRYVDPKGEVWTYRRTPFGMMKFQGEREPENEDKGIRAFDDGDSVRFERTLPTGVTKWTKKKTELTERERKVLESTVKAQQPQEPGKQE